MPVSTVKFIIKINHPESASTLIGISPKTTPVLIISPKECPSTASAATHELIAVLISTEPRAMVPAHDSFIKNISRLKRRVINIMKRLKLILLR
jgi:hypothetical protein